MNMVSSKKIPSLSVFYSILFVCLFISFYFSSKVFSQALPSSLPTENLPFSISASNLFPTLGDVVTLEILPERERLGSIKNIDWYINSVRVPEWEGSLTRTIEADGGLKNVSVDILYFDTAGNRNVFSTNAILWPVVFNLFWEADSVVTPNYKGYKLAGPGTPINISAKIKFINENGREFDENDFSFKWWVDSSFQETVINRPYFVFEEGGSIINNRLVVRAEATLVPMPTIVLEEEITIPIITPRQIIYRSSLLDGLSTTNALQKTSSVSTPLTLSSFPYFFSQDAFEKDNIEYNWFINGTLQETQKRKIDVLATIEDVLVPIRLQSVNENNREQILDHSFILDL